MPPRLSVPPFRRLETSFSQGAKWNTLISKYIGTIPLGDETSRAAEHSISCGPPPRTPVSSAMIARNCPCRCGLSFREDKILGVHLPMKIGGTVSDLYTKLITFRAFCENLLVRELLESVSHDLPSRSAPSHPASADEPRAIRNTCVPGPY